MSTTVSDIHIYYQYFISAARTLFSLLL